MEDSDFRLDTPLWGWWLQVDEGWVGGIQRRCKGISLAVCTAGQGILAQFEFTIIRRRVERGCYYWASFQVWISSLVACEVSMDMNLLL